MRLGVEGIPKVSWLMLIRLNMKKGDGCALNIPKTGHQLSSVA
jgi:hypothetical protein